MSNPSEHTSGAPDAKRPTGILRNASSYQQPHDTVIAFNNEKAELDEDDDDEESRSETGTYEDAVSGRWGEGPSRVNVVGAEKDFKKLERQLTRRSSLYRTQTGEKTTNDGMDFDLTNYLKDIIPRAEGAGIKRRNLGVAWENLEVTGEGVGAQYIKDFGDPFIGLSNLINPYFWAKKAFSKSEAAPKSVIRTILHPMNGFCKDGEMILVLGRPGAGCSTLLRVLANDRKNYKGVDGDVTYGPFSSEEIRVHHRGEVLYNQEGKHIHILISLSRSGCAYFVCDMSHGN